MADLVPSSYNAGQCPAGVFTTVWRGRYPPPNSASKRCELSGNHTGVDIALLGDVFAVAQGEVVRVKKGRTQNSQCCHVDRCLGDQSKTCDSDAACPSTGPCSPMMCGINGIDASGIHVVLRHTVRQTDGSSKKLYSVYAHLKSVASGIKEPAVNPATGQLVYTTVTCGQKIGEVDTTGCSTGVVFSRF